MSAARVVLVNLNAGLTPQKLSELKAQLRVRFLEAEPGWENPLRPSFNALWHDLHSSHGNANQKKAGFKLSADNLCSNFSRQRLNVKVCLEVSGKNPRFGA